MYTRVSKCGAEYYRRYLSPRHDQAVHWYFTDENHNLEALLFVKVSPAGRSVIGDHDWDNDKAGELASEAERKVLLVTNASLLELFVFVRACVRACVSSVHLCCE